MTGLVLPAGTGNLSFTATFGLNLEPVQNPACTWNFFLRWLNGWNLKVVLHPYLITKLEFEPSLLLRHNTSSLYAAYFRLSCVYLPLIYSKQLVVPGGLYLNSQVSAEWYSCNFVKLYFRVSGFESRLRNQLFIQELSYFPQSLSADVGRVPRLSHKRVHSYPYNSRINFSSMVHRLRRRECSRITRKEQ